MKKIAIFLSVSFFTVSLLTTAGFAAAANNNNTSTAASELEKIQKLKEMVASRVAELNLVEKRGILGTVREISKNTQLTVEDNKGNLRIIDLDELTKFQGLSASKSFGISDLKPGDLISFIGLYNKDTKRLIARMVIATKTLPIQFEGIVTEKNKVDYTLEVTDEKGNRKVIDIGITTKTKSYSKDTDLIKSGFTKIETGQRIIVTGYYDLKDKNRIIADRIIHFVDLPPSGTMKSLFEKQQNQASQSAKNETVSPAPTKKTTNP